MENAFKKLKESKEIVNKIETILNTLEYIQGDMTIEEMVHWANKEAQKEELEVVFNTKDLKNWLNEDRPPNWFTGGF